MALIVPAVWLARRHNMGALDSSLPRAPFWSSLREAAWGLIAPVIILGGMRMGYFTPTEAAVVAVFYGLFVGLCVNCNVQKCKRPPLNTSPSCVFCLPSNT